jgi:hypothetical protein
VSYCGVKIVNCSSLFKTVDALREINQENGASFLTQNKLSKASAMLRVCSQLLLIASFVAVVLAPKIDLQRRFIVTNGTPSYFHIVYPGESINDIACHYRVSAKDIRRFNEIGEGEVVRPGTKLVIPINEHKK